MNNKTIPLNKLRFNPNVIRKLQSYSEREREGQPIDYRTPFYSKAHGSAAPLQGSRISGVDGRIPPEREDLYKLMLEDGVHKLLSEEPNPDIQKFEASFEEYIRSPRSVVLPWADRLPKLLEYFKEVDFKPNMNLFNKAVENVRKAVRKYIPAKSLRPLALDKSMERLPSTTNWGAPFFEAGKQLEYDKDANVTKEHDNRKQYMNVAQRILKAILEDKHPKLEDIAFWCLWRGQEGRDSETKQRIIWGEAHGVTILGSRFFPFIDAAQNSLPWRKALVSQESVDESVAVFMKSHSGQYLYGFDASGFDQHLNADLLNAASDIIIDSFQLTNDEIKIANWYFKNHIVSSPIITPDGLVTGRHGSMPSGTGFTNELDSMCNLIAAEYVSLRTKWELFTSQIQGDDGVFLFKGLDQKSLTQLSEAYSELGFVINEDKQWLSKTSVSYLKRLHCTDKATSFRSYSWVLCGLSNMERPKGWKDAMYSARAIMQTSNLSPEYKGYDNFMRFAVKGDTYGLGMKVKSGSLGVLQAAGGLNAVAERLDFVSFAANQQGLIKEPGSSSSSINVPNLRTAEWVAKEKRST